MAKQELTRIPVHVAIIMDGNGRWALQQGLPRTAGHRQGSDRVKDIVRAADRLGIKILTLYAFSEENWNRPLQEVSFLMSLLKEYLIKERQEIMDNHIKFQVLGDVHRLPGEIVSLVEQLTLDTAQHEGLILNFAVSYSGRSDITRAVNCLREQILAGQRPLTKPITSEDIAANLTTVGMPDPDLLIRTSGEMRISNFLIWQLAYTELYVTEIFWPDFTPEYLEAALAAYKTRERRFGRTGQQLKQKSEESVDGFHDRE